MKITYSASCFTILLMNSMIVSFGLPKFALIPTVGAIYDLPPKFSTILASSDAIRLPVIAIVNPLSDIDVIHTCSKICSDYSK
ncbi:MAG TPA: hypothetical protein VN704_11940 [Verrucomicrobiae bacterium]|nr:hypothetical protein [Verrucomicrobiae bacterium]